MSQIDLIGGGPKPLPAVGRIEGDAYYTPDALALAAVAAVQGLLLEQEGAPIEGICWEPHVGGGAWARALLRLTAAPLFVSDIDPEAAGLSGWPKDRHPYSARGGLSFLASNFTAAHWIIGNPPYDQAEQHVRRALQLSRRHVVMLLRLAFLESMARAPFWAESPLRHVWVLAKRPSFSACGKTDSAAYGLFWWDHAHVGNPPTLTPGWDWRSAALDLGGHIPAGTLTHGGDVPAFNLEK